MIPSINEAQAQANALYQQFANSLIAALSGRGFNVANIRREAGQFAPVGSPLTTSEIWHADLSRDGFTMPVTLTGTTSDMGLLADNFEEIFVLNASMSTGRQHHYSAVYDARLAARIGQPTGNTVQGSVPPATTSGPSGTAPPASASGPAGSVPVGTNTATLQAINQGVNTGTAPPPAPPAAPVETRHNWDEWNWIMERETGRAGPPPETYGVADRAARITRAEWWAVAAPWYSAAPTPQNAAAPQNAAPASQGGQRTLLGALIAWILSLFGRNGGAA